MLLLLQMSAVGITENAKGDNKKFEIWCNSRDEVFIVQVRFLYLLCKFRCFTGEQVDNYVQIQVYFIVVLYK